MFRNKSNYEIKFIDKITLKNEIIDKDNYFKIGYCNSKQFINRLNSFGITESELVLAVEKILGEEV